MVTHDYMQTQTEINEKMRAILADWLVDVHQKFGILEETLHLAVNLVDRYLCCRTAQCDELQLVGVTALLVACKYEEIKPPSLGDFEFVTDGSCCAAQILEMERHLLITLNYSITIQSSATFLELFFALLTARLKPLQLLSAFIPLTGHTLIQSEVLAYVRCLALYLLDLQLLDYKMVLNRPSIIAVSCLKAALSLVHIKVVHDNEVSWPQDFTGLCDGSETEVDFCVETVLNLALEQHLESLHGAHQKYNQAAYFHVSRISACECTKEKTQSASS